MNKVILIGNLTKAVVKKYLNGGTCVAESSLAINHHFKKQDGSKDVEVCFIDLVIYGKTAEIIHEYTKKGTKLLVEGRIKQNVWQDSKGNTKSKHFILVEKIELLVRKEKEENEGNKQENTQSTQSQQTPPHNHSVVIPNELGVTEIPF